MKKKLPKIDSIDELARFCASHDLTDFEGELEEVEGKVFAGGDAIQLHLQPREAKAVRRLAKSRGMSEGELVR